MAEAAAQASATRSVVVFDFDGTLVNRDSFFDFAVGYCLARPGRLLLMVAVLPVALLLALRSRTAGGSTLLWAMTLGLSTRRFVLLIRHYARHTLPSYAHDAIFEELERHVREGDRVVIATASVPVMVRGLFFARRLRMPPIVGSRLRRKWGGLIAETHCIGRVKVRELARRLGINDWSAVYTDSFADRSLLRRAREITLVGPSDRTLARTEELRGNTAVLRVLRPR
jgi:phosphatidylglycerophosphatase C